MLNGNSKTSKPVIVGLIYADWCGHCKTFKPEEWDKNIKPKLEEKGIEVKDLDHSNGDNPETKEIHPRLSAGGFPTIYKIEDGKDPEYFEGERSADAIIKWATSTTQRGGLGCGCNKKKSLWNGGKKKSTKRKSKKATKKLKRNKHKRTVRK